MQNIYFSKGIFCGLTFEFLLGFVLRSAPCFCSLAFMRTLNKNDNLITAAPIVALYFIYKS